MTTTYTLEEVSKHKKHGDTWLVIKNKVYDVSKFMEQHPGGEEVLLDSAGRDATQDFEDVGHSEEANKMLADYYVGGNSGAPKRETKAATSTPKTEVKAESSSVSTYVALALVGIAAIAYFVLGRSH